MSNEQERKNLSRRDFLKTAGAGGAGVILAAAGTTVVGGGCKPTSKPTETTSKPAGKLVPARKFGKTGATVSALALGGMFDVINNQMMLKQAIKWGVTYWDTADCYGNGSSEEGYGKFFAQNPDERKKIFLVTKSDARDTEGMTRLLNQSLKRLNTDYIDLYFIHGLPNADEFGTNQAAWKKWAQKAKEEKKIRFFGFSTHSNMPSCLQAAAKTDFIDGIMLTYNYRVMAGKDMKAAIDACNKAGIGLTAMKTQAKDFSKNEQEAKQERELLQRFLEKDFTQAQGCLKSVWTDPRIASICSQMPNMNILMANVAAAANKTELTPDDMKLMQEKATETASAYCAGCSEICEGQAGCSIPVSDVMRYMMYCNSYNEPARAKELFAKLPVGVRSRLADTDYSLAEKKCPQGIAIGRIMRQAAKVLA